MNSELSALKPILSRFIRGSEPVRIAPYGNGHINGTFLAEFPQGQDRVILQKINRRVFPEPEKLQENIQKVTEYLRKQAEADGGNPTREVLQLLPAENGKTFVTDSSGEYWRCVRFISDSFCKDQPDSPEQFSEGAFAFGRFQKMLADYPAETLYAVLPDFHNTGKRYLHFLEAVEKDAAGRAASVQKEIRFLSDRKELAFFFEKEKKAQELPLRVTHNDAKLNNVLFDSLTKKSLCVIDLDTVMPGLAMHDFGDIVRFGASTAAEDERDLSKVSLNMELYQSSLQGFLSGCGGSLSDREVRLLPHGALVITYEQALRFLTDYLEGDVYYKTAYPDHNLVRCRTQIRLAEDMEGKWEEMEKAAAKG